MVVGQQPAYDGEGVLLAGQDVDQHPVVDPHPALQLLGDAGDELVEGLLVPHDRARRRLAELRLGLLVAAGRGLLLGLLVVDDVLGRLHDDVAGAVVAGPARPAGDLLELADLQHPLPAAVELGQPAEQHGADRDVDADAERVGAADDRQQPRLGELLDDAAVLRQHPGVVDADAGAQQLVQGLAEPGAEPQPGRPGRDRLLVGELAEHGGAQQRRRVLDRSGLGEVDDVDGRLVGHDQLLEGVGERLGRPGEAQRHRPDGVGDHGGVPAGTPRQVLGDRRDVAERGRHQQELGVPQLQQRHLPGPAAAGLGVEVELVHDDQTDVGPVPLAQRDVGQHLGGAADDRGVRVDRRVTGQQPDVVGAEDLARARRTSR